MGQTNQDYHSGEFVPKPNRYCAIGACYKRMRYQYSTLRVSDIVDRRNQCRKVGWDQMDGLGLGLGFCHSHWYMLPMQRHPLALYEMHRAFYLQCKSPSVNMIDCRRVCVLCPALYLKSNHDMFYIRTLKGNPGVSHTASFPLFVVHNMKSNALESI